MIQNGDCYFTRECEALGVPLLVTPVPSFKEQGIVDGVNGYYLDFDMKNVDVDKIYNNIPEYESYIMNDKWNEILVHNKSTYKEELKMKYLVEATNKYIKANKYDGELSKEKGIRYYPKEGEQWVVDSLRKDKLVNEGYVVVISTIDEVETAIKEPVVEKAVKKTTRKKKNNDIQR